METKRITVNSSFKQGNNLEFYIVTGSLEEPIICLADNNGFPYVSDIYARAVLHPHGHEGIYVTVRFETEANGNGLAVNISQPNMSGDYSVISPSR